MIVSRGKVIKNLQAHDGFPEQPALASQQRPWQSAFTCVTIPFLSGGCKAPVLQQVHQSSPWQGLTGLGRPCGAQPGARVG